MTNSERLGQKAFEFAEGLWQRGDAWEFDTSEFDRARWARSIEVLDDGARYPKALELGCGAGHFTRLLRPLADRIVAFDISPSAVERGRAAESASSTIEYRVGNAMDYGWRADGPWDLVVLNDTICYLGWLYPFFDVAWFASEIHAAVRPGGRFLMANAMDAQYDKLLLPYITHTYRDLFCNVGLRLAREETFSGTKHDVRFDVLISLFEKPREA
jgi:SAM-dependent methyltransferase